VDCRIQPACFTDVVFQVHLLADDVLVHPLFVHLLFQLGNSDSHVYVSTFRITSSEMLRRAEQTRDGIVRLCFVTVPQVVFRLDPTRRPATPDCV
jgi:hypothetical protein